MTESANAWLEGVSPGIEGQRFELGSAPIRLGRGIACAVILADPMVSREHAEIHYQSGGFEIVDLGSAHGTWVDGKRIQQAGLTDGTRIRLGTSGLVFRLPQDAIPTAMLGAQGPAAVAASHAPGRPIPSSAPRAYEPASAGPPVPPASRGAVAPASPAKPTRRNRLLIGCGVAVLLALCACAGIYLVAMVAGSSSGWTAAINRLLGSGGQAYTQDDLALALAAPTVDERPQILENLGRPDEFDISIVQVEGGQVRLESWRYYGFGTRVDFVDGVIVWTVDLEPASNATTFPAWYDPTAFETGMPIDAAVAMLTAASPAGFAPEQFDLSAGGEDVAGGVLLVGDQITLGFDNGRLVYVETIGASTQEAGG